MAIQIQAAVQLEATRNAGRFDTGGVRPSAVTIPTHPIGSGANRAIFVGISTQITTVPAGAPANRVTRVTFGPQSSCSTPQPANSTCEFQRINTLATFSPDNRNAVELFVLVAPPADTTADIEISLILAGVDYVVAGSASYTGVNQTTPHGAYQSATGTNDNPTVSVLDGLNGDYILDTLSLNFGFSAAINPFPDAQRTVIAQGRNFFGGFSDVGTASTKPDSTSNSTDPMAMSWTLSGSTNWALGAVAVKQSVSTAAYASIKGQVKTKYDEPLSNVSITVQNLQTGETFNVTTDNNGFYHFDELVSANIYQIKAFNNFYTFAPDNQVLNLNESVEGVNFYATRRNRKKTFIQKINRSF